ncbi:MAG: insulinase family protein [Pyrinomonadaceae bacterium]|nr:insulinase family protein [Pyrinomonadaceae bacterium]
MTEQFRKTPPASLAPIPFHIPQPFETELENGLKIIIFENKRLPIINLRLAFRFGEINSPKEWRGLASAVSSLLTQGTENYSSKELAEEVEKLGASLHASSSSDNSTISASALTLYRSEILRLMTEILFKPTFPENELNLYKQNTIKGLEFQRSQADFLADEQTARIIFGSHPYGTVSPTKEQVEGLSREMLIDFHRQKMIPNNALLIVVGDVDKDEFLAELNQVFGEWKRGNVEKSEFPTPPIRTQKTLTIVDRVGSAQSNIVLSNLGMERTNPDYFPVLVMNQILGAGASSRLFMNIREEKGYTYGAYSSFDSRRLTGSFEATAEVRTAVTGDSLKEFFYELNRIRDEKVGENELQDAKNFLTGVFPIRAETQEGLTNLIVAQKLYQLPDDYLQTYRDKINAVTIEEVQRVANTYIHPDKIAIIIVGDAEEILKQAKTYADSIEIFDTDGKPLDVTKYESQEGQLPANINGKWEVFIELQGQQMPVTFELNQADSAFTGNFESLLGIGKITEGTINGSKIKGKILVDFQGQEVEISLNGNVENENSIKGILAPQMEGLPDLPFSGNKQ